MKYSHAQHEYDVISGGFRSFSSIRNRNPWHSDVILMIFFSCDHTKVDPEVRSYCSKDNNVWWHLPTAKVIATNLCQAQKNGKADDYKNWSYFIRFYTTAKAENYV